MGFSGGSGFSSSPGANSFIRVKESDGNPDVLKVKTIIVTSGTLTYDGNGVVSLDTGGGGSSANISGTDGQIAVFSGSSNIVGYNKLTYDQTDLHLTGNIRANNAFVTNVITGDLHVKNERGDWTIFEEKNCLVVQNNLTGKRFKLLMEAIEE